MNDRQRIQLAKALAGRMADIARKLDTIENNTTLIGRMREQQGNLRARAYDGAPVRFGTDVVGGTATAMTDQAVLDEEHLDLLLKRLAHNTNIAVTIINRYPVPRRPTATDRADLGLVRSDPGCENCARTEAAAGGPRWEPPRTATPTTVEDRLEEPALLCDWCYQRVRAWGRLPTPAELDRHHRGDRVSWPSDVPRPPDRRGGPTWIGDIVNDAVGRIHESPDE